MNIPINAQKLLCWYLISLLAITAKSYGFNGTLVDVEIGENCEALLEKYATKTANFTRCVIRHARPILICQKCIREFIAVGKVHNDILKLHEESGEACKKELLSVDRLDVIEASFKFVNGQWRNAACKKCFTSECNSTKLNPGTVKIFQLHNETDTCLVESMKRNSTTLCDDCRSLYSSLNKFYGPEGSQRFCMDVVDMINSTRFEWSEKYNCSATYEKPDIILFTSSIIVCLIPVVFYSTIWFLSTFSFPEISTQNRWIRRFRRSSNAT